MSSVKHLQGLMDDSKWPENLTIEDNLIDLGWHQREFTLAIRLHTLYLEKAESI